MKKAVLFFIFFFACSLAQAQIFNPDLRSAKKTQKRLVESGWEIILDPRESTPAKGSRRNSVSMAAETNWGRDVVLPAGVVERLKSECKYNVVLKIFDTGGLMDHAALEKGQLRGSNYTTSATLSDAQGHGTHVAGIAVAQGIGVLWPLVDAGIVEWKPVKVLGDDGQGSFTWIERAIRTEEVDNRAQVRAGKFVVANGSFGGGVTKVQGVESALRESTAAGGVTYCFAAGNTGQTGVIYPGNSDFVIACGSLTKGLNLSSFSTRGPQVFASMPGSSINSTYKGNTYATLSGTSMATPFLSSAVAIARAKWGPGIRDNNHMRLYLAWCATDLGAKGKDDSFGWGIEYIKSILDKDPALTPGLPDSPKDTTGVERTIIYTFKDLVTAWDFLPGQSTQMAHIKVKGAAEQKMKVNYVEVAYTSRYPHNKAHANMSKAVPYYFSSRTLYIPANGDFADAVSWTAYFLDLILYQEFSHNIEVMRIEAQDAEGVPVILNSNSLRKWTPPGK